MKLNIWNKIVNSFLDILFQKITEEKMNLKIDITIKAQKEEKK